MSDEIIEVETDEPAVQGELLRGDLLPAVLAPPTALEVALTPAQKELVIQLNPGATPAELQVFFYQCARTGLDPIAHQTYLIRRDGKMTIQTGIDGYRLVASRSGMMAGSDDPLFGADTAEQRCNGGNRPASASVTVWKIAADGQRYPYTATARWEEYAPNLDDKQAFMWRRMPYLLLGKCAEALALRKAFPAELSGVYTDAEMDQAGLGTAIAEARPTGPPCPHCKTPVEHNSEEVRASKRKPGRRDIPIWSCPNRSCGGGNTKPDGSRYSWASYEPDFFVVPEPELVVIQPAVPAPAVPADAWDLPNPELFDTALAVASAGPDTRTISSLSASVRALYGAMANARLWPEDALPKAFAKAHVTSVHKIGKKADIEAWVGRAFAYAQATVARALEEESNAHPRIEVSQAQLAGGEPFE